MPKTTPTPGTPSTPGKPDQHVKSSEESVETTPESEGPLDTEGGRRSPLNGKFEADHRPSR